MKLNAMELEFSQNKTIVQNILKQIDNSLELISEWNKTIKSPEDYLSSPEGMRTLAATCMLLESIGEGIKKVDKIMPNFLFKIAPDMPWKQIKGLRDHIAHGYFDIDAEVIYDVVKSEITRLLNAVNMLRNNL